MTTTEQRVRPVDRSHTAYRLYQAAIDANASALHALLDGFEPMRGAKHVLRDGLTGMTVRSTASCTLISFPAPDAASGVGTIEMPLAVEYGVVVQVVTALRDAATAKATAPR